jgi:hypothetical protein
VIHSLFWRESYRSLNPLAQKLPLSHFEVGIPTLRASMNGHAVISAANAADQKREPNGGRRSQPRP